MYLQQNTVQEKHYAWVIKTKYAITSVFCVDTDQSHSIANNYRLIKV